MSVFLIWHSCHSCWPRNSLNSWLLRNGRQIDRQISLYFLCFKFFWCFGVCYCLLVEKWYWAKWFFFFVCHIVIDSLHVVRWGSTELQNPKPDWQELILLKSLIEEFDADNNLLTFSSMPSVLDTGLDLGGFSVFCSDNSLLSDRIIERIELEGTSRSSSCAYLSCSVSSHATRECWPANRHHLVKNTHKNPSILFLCWFFCHLQ